MWNEFKKFAVRGNVIDLAIGVVIGSAFSKIVSSFVNDIVSPLLSILTGKIDFSNLFIVLGNGHFNTLEEAKKSGVATINYGLFINNIIDFLVISFSIYIIISQINRLKDKMTKKENIVSTKICNYCYSEIHINAKKCPHCTSDLE